MVSRPTRVRGPRGTPANMIARRKTGAIVPCFDSDALGLRRRNRMTNQEAHLHPITPWPHRFEQRDGPKATSSFSPAKQSLLQRTKICCAMVVPAAHTRHESQGRTLCCLLFLLAAPALVDPFVLQARHMAGCKDQAVNAVQKIGSHPVSNRQPSLEDLKSWRLPRRPP